MPNRKGIVAAAAGLAALLVCAPVAALELDEAEQALAKRLQELALRAVPDKSEDDIRSRVGISSQLPKVDASSPDVGITIRDFGTRGDVLPVRHQARVQLYGAEAVEVAGYPGIAEEDRGYRVALRIGRVEVVVQRAEADLAAARAAFQAMDLDAIHAYAKEAPAPDTGYWYPRLDRFLPREIAGLGKSRRNGIYGEPPGGMRMGMRRYGEVSVAIVDQGSHAEASAKGLAALAERHGWRRVGVGEHDGWVAGGDMPRLYLPLGRFRAEVAAETDVGEDVLVKAGAAVPAELLARLADSLAPAEVTHDNLLAPARPVAPHRLAALVPDRIDGYVRRFAKVKRKGLAPGFALNMMQVGLLGPNGEEMLVMLYDWGVPVPYIGEEGPRNADPGTLQTESLDGQEIHLALWRGNPMGWMTAGGRLAAVVRVGNSDGSLEPVRAALAAVGPERLARLADEAPQPTVATCGDRACFRKAFAACEAGSSYRTRARGLGRAFYEIEGPGEGGCRLRLTYEDNRGNPAWVGLPLTLTLDPSQEFLAAVKQGVEACAAGAGACEGPLAEVLAGQ